MNTAKELYDRWLAQPELDTAVAEELHGIAGDDAAITDRFYRDLEFGTGGLRGVLGAGTNRMNLYTVRKAVPQLPEQCLSRKAGIVRCCLCYFAFLSASAVVLGCASAACFRASCSEKCWIILSFASCKWRLLMALASSALLVSRQCTISRCSSIDSLKRWVLVSE